MRGYWFLALSGFLVFLAAVGTFALVGRSADGGSGAPEVVREAPTAALTLAPSPTPEPPPAAHCYRPRVAGLPGSPTGGAAASTGGTEGGAGFVLLPAAADSVFLGCQVISYYGHPESALMGALGEGEPEAMVQRLLAQAAAYDWVNGERGVVPALHLIYAVAQGAQTPDGTALWRMDDAVVRRYLDVAERYDLLVFLDVQVGLSNVAAELPHVLPYLRNPRVHLALDPEFAMPPGVLPGTIIGSLDAAQINHAQDALQRLVEAEGLPNKILVVHQFLPDMLPDKLALRDYPDVDLVIDMDGFGSSFAKVTKYELFVSAEGAEHGGMKLFYQHDVDLLAPEQVVRLLPQPDVVIYQ